MPLHGPGRRGSGDRGAQACPAPPRAWNGPAVSHPGQPPASAQCPAPKTRPARQPVLASGSCPARAVPRTAAEHSVTCLGSPNKPGRWVLLSLWCGWKSRGALVPAPSGWVAARMSAHAHRPPTACSRSVMKQPHGKERRALLAYALRRALRYVTFA